MVKREDAPLPRTCVREHPPWKREGCEKVQGGKGTSQQGRVANRGTAKATRVPDERRRRVGESGRGSQEAKTSSVADVSATGNEAEAKRKPQVPAANRSKPRVITYSREDENRVSSSIQRLLSVYQSAKADKSPDGPRPPNAPKPRIHGKPARGNASRIPETAGGLKSWPSYVDAARARTGPAQGRNPGAGGSEETQPPKTLRKARLSPEASKAEMSAESEGDKAPEKEAGACDEIIPLLAPDRTTHSPLTQIHSFIAKYVGEDCENLRDSKNKLELFVPENSGHAFPVCGKRATDHIPSSGAARPETPPSTREVIIMLRRRKSEPHSPGSCVLQYSRREEGAPLSPAGSGPWGLGHDGYCFWEQGPVRPSRPYWEVSLFKSDKSSCAVTSSAGLLSLTPPRDTGEILVDGDFGLRDRERAALPDRALKPWDRDVHSCKSLVRTIPFASSMEAVARVPRGPARVQTSPTPEARPRGISRDDHYKHPAHLLVYVKSSQKKLVSLDSEGSRAGEFGNRKVHKIKKILGGVSEARGTSPSKNVVLAVLSAVLLLSGGFALFVYFLARGPALFSLTPPVPGLLRRC